MGVSKDYPSIEYDDIIVDNCTMQLVSKPEQFDVMATPNLYGNIIGNMLCGLVGGPGLVSGGNFNGFNTETDLAVFEQATRNAGRNIAGANTANQTSRRRRSRHQRGPHPHRRHWRHAQDFRFYE